jgi:predicted nuclease of predicted toxin-antitoxin system
VKFKVDENLPEELSQLFREAGWDSLTVVDQQLSGEIDPQIARACRDELRILVTFDRGFSNIRAYPPADSPGMIVYRLRSQDKRHVLAISARLIAALSRRTLRNELWIVHEDRIRIRAVAPI